MGFRILWAQNPIVDFVKQGKATTDPLFISLIARFIQKALKDRNVRDVVARHPFDAEDLCALYYGMILSLMPNPLVKTSHLQSSYVLAATIPFAEPERLDVILRQISYDIYPGMDSSQRRIVIFDHAARNAEAMWRAHTAAYGEAAL